MACCWSSAMFKSSLNAIPRIQCLPCQHNSALCKQYLYSVFFFSLQWISRLIQKYVVSPLSSSISAPKSCEFSLPFIEAFRQLMTITFVIVVEKICFHLLFGISLYQSPRVQVVLQSPLHFDSIISFSTQKKPLSYQIKNSFWLWKSSISIKAIQYPHWSHHSCFKIYGSKNVFSVYKYVPKKTTEKDKKK